MFKQTQRSFAGGALDAELMGRTDLAKYYSGASKIENFLVRRQGSLAKRRGTNFACDLTGILGQADGATRPLGSHRLVPISQVRDKGYYALFADRRAFILDTARGILCTDGEWRRSAPAYAAPTVGNAVETDTGYRLEAVFAARIGTTFYATLAAAIAAHGEGDEIVLGQDADLDADMIYAVTGNRNAKKVTLKGVLDLNGHTLTVGGNYSIAFATTSADTVCGIKSSAEGARIAFSDTLATTAANYLLEHTKGTLVLRDFACDHPFTASTACILYSNAAEGVEMTRCTWSGKGGYGLVHLHNAIENQSAVSISTPSMPQGSVIVEGCALEWDYGSSLTTAYFAFSNAIQNANARKVIFKSGSLKCRDSQYRLAAKLGLFVFGGLLDCYAIGNTTSYAAATSRMISGLCSHEVGSNYLMTDENGQTLLRVDEDGNAIVESVDGTAYYSYAQEGLIYTAAMNTWPPLEYTPAPEAAPSDESSLSLTTGSAPYCVAMPYSDAELDELDVFQSGDTLFLAHADHSPATLVFLADGPALVFSRMKFNSGALKRPFIKSVTDKIHQNKTESSVQGSTTYVTRTTYTTNDSECKKTTQVSSGNSVTSTSTSSLPLKTVWYCATCVKDGVEGPPSNPVAVTYGAPWEEGGTVTLVIDRGANAEEPDYYNVYKKETTMFGLVGTAGRTENATGKLPSTAVGYQVAANNSASTFLPGLLPTMLLNGSGLRTTERVDVLGRVPGLTAAEDAVDVSGALGSYRLRPGAGGMSFGGNTAIIDYGKESAVRADTVEIAFDSHTLEYAENAQAGTVAVSDRMKLSGKTVKITVHYQPTDGENRSLSSATATVTLDAADIGQDETAYAGAHTRACGSFAPGDDLPAGAAAAPRTARATFAELAGGDRQIVTVIVECLDENGDPCECVICGYSLSLAAKAGSSFTDDYITPDMSMTPPSVEDSFAASGDFPSCVGIYQQRLVFAASKSRPSAFWMSAVGDLYTFAAHESIREDDALSAELAATEFPRINHLVFSRDVIILSDSGEWKVAPVSGNALTYKTLSATLQSSIGSAKWLKPLAVGNEVVFAERTGMALRSVTYNFASDGYESQDLTVLSGNIFANNAIRRMCYKQHPDSTIVCTLADGTVAALVYMKEHEVVAWSRHVLGGGWLAREVATNKALNGNTTDVALTVEKGGRTELWAVRPDDTSATVAAQVCMDGCRVMTGAQAAQEGTWLEGWAAVDLLAGAVYAAAADLDAARSYIVGFPIRSELVTVRPEPSPDDTIQFELKNVKSVEARVMAAGKYTVKSYAAGAGVRPTAAKAPVPVAAGTVVRTTTDVATTVMGANTGDGRVQLVHDDVWPISILQLSTNYEIQPMSGAAG